VSVQESSEESAGIARPASQRRPEYNELIVSYMYLRKTVGWIGSLLPVVLIASSLFFTTRPYSMSGYYYTHMRNVFVGALCALGVFLVAYAGYDDVDRWITNIAGGCAIGVAFCPTKPTVCAPHAQTCLPPSVRQLSTFQEVVGDIHLFFAAVTFIALGLMALRFAKRGETPEGLDVMGKIRYGLGFAGPADGKRQSQKQKLNAVYRVCGIVILSCVVLAALSNLLPASIKADVPLLFIFEALAVFGFGISWFVKGRTLQSLIPFLRDPSRPDSGTASAG
jgi:hypothetical protein